MITDIAKDSIIEVLRQDSPMKKSKVSKLHQAYAHASKRKYLPSNHIDLYSSDSDTSIDDHQVQAAIARSLGVTATALAKDPLIAGNIGLKNQLRGEMGDNPSTVLNAEGKTVAQYWDSRKKARNHRSKSSRFSRNDLLDLTGEEPEVRTKKEKLGKRIKLKLLWLGMSASGPEKEVMRKKVKFAIDALDPRARITEANEMIPYIYNLHVSDANSFDSTDAAKNILEYASEEEN